LLQTKVPTPTRKYNAHAALSASEYTSIHSRIFTVLAAMLAAAA
jgi:hypothetical protein